MIRTLFLSSGVKTNIKASVGSQILLGRRFSIILQLFIWDDEMRPRARELGLEIGIITPGNKNAISDVKDVKVGHCTIIRGEGKLIPGKGPVRTGVTAVIPHPRNIYKEKVPAASFVMNGYGKSIGLIQVEEFGVLETPILLTSTLCTWKAADALVQYMLDQNEDIGVTTGSVNPVVMECNDSYLNDLRGRHVSAEHVMKALENASETFEMGSVGAGTGMVAFEFKGGIGTSSRVVEVEGEEFTVGSLVLSNFGRREDLTINGIRVGLILKNYGHRKLRKVKGSIIMLLATDAPLLYRQLKRLAKRAIIGLARTGGRSYNGSGDIVIAFSINYTIPHYGKEKFKMEVLKDASLNPLFAAAAEATEEAIIDSLFTAETMIGRDNHVVDALPTEEVVKLLNSIKSP